MHASPSRFTTSPPPVRRALSPRIASTQIPPASMTGTSSTKAGAPLQGSSEDSLRVPREDRFNGALYSLKAFSIATTLVIAGSAASVWGVKVYLGVKDVRERLHLLIIFSPLSRAANLTGYLSSQTQEFASAMRLTVLNRWPLLTSRIHRSSGDSSTQPSLWPPASVPSATDRTAYESPDSPPPTSGLAPDERLDGSRWCWPAAQSRLAEAYERGGLTHFAEAAVSELEAESELERHKRGLVDPIQVQK